MNQAAHNFIGKAILPVSQSLEKKNIMFPFAYDLLQINSLYIISHCREPHIRETEDWLGQ